MHSRFVRYGLVAVVLAGCEKPLEPVALEPAAPRRLSASEQTTCALATGNAVFCWGTSVFGEMGKTGSVLRHEPTASEVPIINSFASGNGWHRCGLTGTTTVCWGRGTFGQLGDGSLGETSNPVTTVLSADRWVDLSVGRLTTCALERDGDAYCWGFNQSGEIGDSLVAVGARVSTPNKVPGGIRFAAISVGWRHACGLSTAGSLYCWGENRNGELGLADTVDRRMPALVPFARAFQQVSSSAASSCALTIDGELFCWGYNGFGQLGDGTTATRLTPTPVSSSLRFKSLALGTGFGGDSFTAVPGTPQGGYGFGCAIAIDGTIHCWGFNANGQLGDGTTDHRLIPVTVTSTEAFSEIALGGAHACARSGASIYCWGSNASYQVAGTIRQNILVPGNVAGSW